jgi:hypothetical protein
MMNTYAKTKKELDDIRHAYACKGEIVFRTALQYIVEYGQSTFNDDGWVENQLTLIDVKHDKAEAEGKILWIGREFERAFIECAREIAKVDAYSMLVYIQKEVWLSHEGGIDYERSVQLLKSCMSWIEEDHASLGEMLDTLEYIGFDDDDIEALGFAYVLDVREDEEDA